MRIRSEAGIPALSKVALAATRLGELEESELDERESSIFMLLLLLFHPSFCCLHSDCSTATRHSPDLDESSGDPCLQQKRFHGGAQAQMDWN